MRTRIHIPLLCLPCCVTLGPFLNISVHNFPHLEKGAVVYIPLSVVAKIVYVCVSCSLVSDSLQCHGLLPTRLLCPWDSPGKNPEVGCHSLPQESFPTRGLNSGLLHSRQILYHLSHEGSPLVSKRKTFWILLVYSKCHICIICAFGPSCLRIFL